MEVNVKLVRASYESLKAEYESLEDIELNLFSSIGNINNFDWIDGNSMDFAKAIEPEKLEIDTFQMYVFSLIKIFNDIYYSYKKLGKKIKCNLDKKNAVITSINNNISIVESILNEYNRTDLDFPYGEFSTLRSCKNNYKEIKKKLINMKKYFNSLFSEISELEAKIANKIREIEEFTPKEFDFNLFAKRPLHDFDKGYLLYNDFDLDYKKVVYYKNAEKDSNQNIYKGMKNIEDSYISKNNNAYLTNVENYKKDFLALFVKRNKYIKTLSEVPTLYDKAAMDTIKTFEEAEICMKEK